MKIVGEAAFHANLSSLRWPRVPGIPGGECDRLPTDWPYTAGSAGLACTNGRSDVPDGTFTMKNPAAGILREFTELHHRTLRLRHYQRQRLRHSKQRRDGIAAPVRHCEFLVGKSTIRGNSGRSESGHHKMWFSPASITHRLSSGSRDVTPARKRVAWVRAIQGLFPYPVTTRPGSLEIKLSCRKLSKIAP